MGIKYSRVYNDIFFESQVILGPGIVSQLAYREPQKIQKSLQKIMLKLPQLKFLNQHALALWSEIHIFLYLDKTKQGYDHLIANWPKLRWGMFLQMKIYNAWFSDLRSRAAIAKALEETAPQNKTKLLKEAKIFAKKLEKDPMPGFRVFHWILNGCASHAQGEKEQAESYFRQGVTEYAAQSMKLHENVARHRLGEIVGGDAGNALIAQALAYMQDQGIVRPDRWLAMLAPMGKA